MASISRPPSSLVEHTIAITADEASLDEPLPLPVQEDQEHSSWLSQIQLYARAFALGSQGVSGPELATALTGFNATLCPPVDSIGLELAIEAGDLEAQAHSATPAPTLEQAIVTKDVAALYACLSQLVELHTVSPISYALKKSEI